MGDSSSGAAKAVHRSGSNTASAIAVKAAFTRDGTIKKGASKSVVEKAKKVLRQTIKRKVAGRTTRKTNAAAKAAAAPAALRASNLGKNAARAALNRTRLRGD